MTSSEYKKLKTIIRKKTSRLKVEVDEHAIKLDELDELVEEKTRNVIKKKLIDKVIGAIQTDLEALENKLLNNVANKYYDYIKDQADAIIKSEFKKGILHKHKIIYSDIMHEYDPIGLMNNGWRIVYQGPLIFDKNKRKDVIIFEKPVSTKAHAKVTIKNKKKNKKVKRSPK
jgi:hypothetical protein